MKHDDPFTVETTLSATPSETFMAPCGLGTPHALLAGCSVEGGSTKTLVETSTGQPVLHITAEATTVRISYRFAPGSARYPEAIFTPQENRFTRAADGLLSRAQAIAPDLPPLERATAIARAVAELFTYGHPETRFNDGMDEVPALGCGLTEGSCVDINTYFVASLRAAGIDTGYITGCFFPAEKGDHCSDMHCWVVTRIDGAYQEWDIAHHLKLGTREISHSSNPKPGFRAALAHSMGLDIPALNVIEMKLMAEPMRLGPDGPVSLPDLEIRLRHPAITALAS